MDIGSQDGIKAAVNRLRDLDPAGTKLVKDASGWPDISTLPTDLSTWKAWDKLQRTLQILKDDHDGSGSGNPPSGGGGEYPTVPSKSVGKSGLYFYNLYDVEGAIQLAKKHGLWIALLVNELDGTPQRDGSPLPESYIREQRDRIKAAGILCLATGWAEPDYDLSAQAEFIAHMSAGFDEYMLNIEAAWAYPAPGFSASDTFAPLLRECLGDFPLSLCPDWGNPIHWLPWLQAGMSAIRVQCYLNQWPHKTPAEGLAKLSEGQHDLPYGVPAGIAREVVYGKYGGYLAPLSSWTAEDERAGKPPASVWAAETADESDCAWLQNR